MTNKISIIIPMYNVEKYLRRCLDSVKNQTFKEWQAICVDDGSPDNSGKIAEEYAKKDKRFKVLHKKNGGLSDARNYGMKYATGKYIMFLDSDDFIHPQTMEITYTLAEQNNSDMVSFTYDRIYRPQLMVKHVLGLSTDNVTPFGIHKKYNLKRLKTKVVSDIFNFVTEYSHNSGNPNKKWMIKHCQVWKNLYRKSLISDIKFIKGILFEDFPWWSEVLLREPKTTITNLPLYYYTPNFGGIVLSSKQLRIMQCISKGIKTAYNLYKSKATSVQMSKWQEQFMWCFINWSFKKRKYLYTQEDLLIAKKEFQEMATIGVFDSVPNEWFDLREEIYNFINNE